MRRSGKPVMVQSHYADLKTSSLDVLRRAGVPYERHVETAVRCLAHAAAGIELPNAFFTAGRLSLLLDKPFGAIDG